MAHDGDGAVDGGASDDAVQPGATGPGQGAPPDVVEVAADVAARPATVWRCLTRADLLSRWLSADAAIEPRLGGAVRIDFARHATVVEGVVDELRENEVLAFTWGVAEGDQKDALPLGSTRVTIRLAPTPTGTRVTLRHAGLPTAGSRRDHDLGWHGYLGSLAAVAPASAIDGGPEALFDDWFAAWGTTDAAARDALLARRLADRATYRDVHTDCRGRAGISAWMAQCQALFPGVVVARDGAVSSCRGSLLVRWKVTTQGGAEMARGTTWGRLSADDGRLTAVEAFWGG